MNDARLGIVRLPMPDGRAVPLQFTWGRIDAVGREWIVDRFQKTISGKEGCQSALAELLVLASNGEVKAADLLAEGGEQLAFEPAFLAVEDAWLIARFGPSRKADGQPENPRKSRQTWLRRAFGWLSGQGSLKSSSSRSRRTA